MTSAGPRVRMVAGAVFRTGAAGADELLVIDRPGAGPRLPDGPILDGEDADDAAVRVLREQTGVDAEVRLLIVTVDEVQEGQQRRRSIVILDADEGGPGEWEHEGARCRWVPYADAELDEAHQPWLDLVRVDLA